MELAKECILLVCAEQGFAVHEGTVKSPMTEFIGQGGPFVGREMDPMTRPPLQHIGPMRMPHSGYFSSAVLY
jgi:hypothetical protein